MDNLRTLCRVVPYDPATKKILLVRNKDQNWWYAPGGGWNYQSESILKCADREVIEETGITGVKIERLLYVQTLDIQAENSTWLELFWLGTPAENVEVPAGHIDNHGVVEEARWFSAFELQPLTVYPRQLKGPFWEEVDAISQGSNKYLGHSVL